MDIELISKCLFAFAVGYGFGLTLKSLKVFFEKL